MAKTKKQKNEIVTNLASGIKDSKSVVFANFQGLKVSEMEELRKLCRENDIEVLVAKKTLVNRACEKSGLENIDITSFEGGVGTFMGKTDEVAPAKAVVDFAKKHEVVSVFGGILEGKFVAEDQIKSLASLPSREELLAKMVGSINAPVSGFVNVLAGNIRNLVGVLNNIKEAKA